MSTTNIQPINAIQDEIVEQFEMFDDWMDRYSLLIDMGNNLPAFPEDQRTEQNLIDGCQSKVWLTSEMVDDKIVFHGDSDAILVKGIVALLIQVLSEHTPQEVYDAELYFIDKIGLREHLSPTRSNGMAAMLKQMHLYALVQLKRNDGK